MTTMRKIPLRWVSLGILVCLGGVASFYLSFIFPQNFTIRMLKEELFSDTSNSGSKIDEREVLLQKKELKKVVSSFQKQLLLKEESLLTSLGTLGQKSGVKIISVAPSSVKKDEKGFFNKVSTGISFSGSYPEIVKFINLLENNKTFFRIEKLSLKSEGKIHYAEANLAAYRRN